MTTTTHTHTHTQVSVYPTISDLPLLEADKPRQRRSLLASEEFPRTRSFTAVLVATQVCVCVYMFVCVCAVVCIVVC